MPGIHNSGAMAASGNNSISRLAIDWPMELQRHGRWQRSVLVALSRESDAVDELVQEVALTALRNRQVVRDDPKAAR